MLRYVVNRVLLMIPTMIAISIIVFTIIQLPPGNYLESYIAELQAQGESVDPQKIAFLKQEYGLDKPIPEQYLRWVGGMLRGDFGYSFEFNLPVTKVVGDRMFLTILVSAFTIFFTWAIAFPIGSIRQRTSTAGPITGFRSWASSASPFPTSCWRS
jgi:peptide/nickel transport system permease protein